jgi:RimJ/RimL family protein N-acetyltransferase
VPSRQNEYAQPIGEPVPGWTARSEPPRSPMIGRYCRIEPVDVERHAADLYQAYSEAHDGRDWTYMFAGPFADFASYRQYLTSAVSGADPLHHAIIDLATGKAVGTAALMRIDRTHGVIEVGHIAYSPRLKRTPAATEAMFLLMKRVFDELGYRRYEWKCDHLNAPSRAAALRYGFQFEGIFRQAVIYKGRSRDTAWFSMIDSEWPAVRSGFEEWLRPENFDGAGKQLKRLSDLIDQARSATGSGAG